MFREGIIIIEIQQILLNRRIIRYKDTLFMEQETTRVYWPWELSLEDTQKITTICNRISYRVYFTSGFSNTSVPVLQPLYKLPQAAARRLDCILVFSSLHN
jgi:hypothetical protein